MSPPEAGDAKNEERSDSPKSGHWRSRNARRNEAHEVFVEDGVSLQFGSCMFSRDLSEGTYSIED